MPTEILSHVPKEQIFQNFEPRFRELFRAGNSLLESYHKSYERLLLPASEYFVDYLLTQARDYHASALGYLLDYQYAQEIEDERLAKKSQKMAAHRQALALILSDAANRANVFGGGPQNEKVTSIVNFIQTRALENPACDGVGSELVALFQSERERGFQIPISHSILANVIGDEGCPDTADILRITTAYRIPVDILIVNDRHNDRRGFRQSSDHAIALYEDLYGSPSIPVVVFPNQVLLSEPSAYQFVAELFANGMI